MLKLVVIQIVITTSTDRFFFFLQYSDVLGYKLKYSWSDLSLLSASDILRYIFCPAERIRYMTCRLTSDISTKEFQHYSLLISRMDSRKLTIVWDSISIRISGLMKSRSDFMELKF